MKTKAEMLEYATKMRARGDSFTAVIRYLEHNCSDENLVKEIAREVDALERSGSLDVPKQMDSPASMRDIVMGLLCLGFGVFLLFRLHGLGWFGILPIVLIGVGLMSLFKAIR